MDVYDVVKKLVGYIGPVGITEDDDERFENLIVMTALVDTILTDIDSVAMKKDAPEYSVRRAGQFADEFLARIGRTE